MPAFGTISPDKLMRLIGLPNAPTLIDVRMEEDFAADPRLLPASQRRSHKNAADWCDKLGDGPFVVICQKGLKLSHGVAAWLRQAGCDAEVLEGGFEAWHKAGLPVIPLGEIAPRDGRGRSVWVTRARPKIDRIACPWLIRRFIDPDAVFLFVAPSEVEAVADRFGGVPFDVDGVRWSHRGEFCTFDVMVEAFGLGFEAMSRLAVIVRGADTARPDLAPEVSGLLAASLGFSRMYADDLEQMAATFPLYDALYRWCRDATDETHNWPHKKPGAKA
ncbi:chromate resistance protein ChrB domain-containing protein [Lacibacterium aquatile]|uniref:Chromate resistance protein ChrB domain-containing protein n=1 Tax=Lacibacterium aquatile TaxID=1168082 RepID=A0ABW5DTY2_9PROT